MSIVRTFIPDPPPADHAQGPPTAAHSNLPADEAVWAAARRSYVEEGCSCPVVAERHGLHRRTVSRHAERENWSGARAAHRAAHRRLTPAPPLDDPAAALAEDLRADRLVELLIHPSGDGLVKNLARLAAEAAAAQRPQETLLWLRAVQTADRVADRIDRALAGGRPVEDIFRTRYFQGVYDHVEADMQAEGPETG